MQVLGRPKSNAGSGTPKKNEVLLLVNDSLLAPNSNPSYARLFLTLIANPSGLHPNHAILTNPDSCLISYSGCCAITRPQVYHPR